MTGLRDSMPAIVRSSTSAQGSREVLGRRRTPQDAPGAGRKRGFAHPPPANLDGVRLEPSRVLRSPRRDEVAWRPRGANRGKHPRDHALDGESYEEVCWRELDLVMTVVAIDPSVSGKPGSCETGIIVNGRSDETHPPYPHRGGGQAGGGGRS